MAVVYLLKSVYVDPPDFIEGEINVYQVVQTSERLLFQLRYQVGRQLQPPNFEIGRERLHFLDVVIVEVQDVHVRTQFIVWDIRQIAVGAIRDPVDPEVVAIAVVGAFQFGQLAVEGPNMAEAQSQRDISDGCS